MPFDGTKLNETAQKLIQAKRYIEEHGWCRGSMKAANGAVCIVGAARAVGTKDGTYFIAKALRIHSVVTWNDRPGRTVAEVYQAFDQAIALAIEEG